MARERMITRTIVSIEYSVLAVNMETMKAETVKVTLVSGDTMTEKAREKAIRERIPEGYTYVNVIDSVKVMELYGMSEEEFLKAAKKLPPRTQSETE